MCPQRFTKKNTTKKRFIKSPFESFFRSSHAGLSPWKAEQCTKSVLPLETSFMNEK